MPFLTVPEWSTRKLMLVNGDVDSATVEDQYVKEMMEIPGLNMYKLPQLSISCAMFCQKIDTTGDPYIGSGQLDGAGIPPDFFTDINVRKAFCMRLIVTFTPKMCCKASVLCHPIRLFGIALCH